METEKTSAPKIAVLIRDLIFETKITATAKALNVTVSTLRSLKDLSRWLPDQSPQLLIVDLNTCQGQAMEAIRTAKSNGARVVAFVSHVDVGLANQAREAGADEVMPRSRFVDSLPAILAK